jgi:hypothetical protein
LHIVADLAQFSILAESRHHSPRPQEAVINPTNMPECTCQGLNPTCIRCGGKGFYAPKVRRRGRFSPNEFIKRPAKPCAPARALVPEMELRVRALLQEFRMLLPSHIATVVDDSRFLTQTLIDMLHDEKERTGFSNSAVFEIVRVFPHSRGT